MLCIDEMTIDAVKTLSTGSILSIRSDTAKLSYIPEGVIVSLSYSPPRVIRALPTYLSEIRITCFTPEETIRSIPVDKIVGVDAFLTPTKIAAIKSKNILLFSELRQEDINNIISNLSIRAIAFSPMTPPQVIARLVVQIHQGLENYCRNKGARELEVKNPLVAETVRVANVRSPILAGDEMAALIGKNKILETQNVLLQLQLNAAQQVALQVTQQPPQPAASKSYPKMSIGKIRKSWAIEELRDENERLKKALDQATREKNLAEAEVRRYSEIVYKGSSLKFLSELLRPSLTTPVVPEPDLDTSETSLGIGQGISPK